MARTLTLKHF